MPTIDELEEYLAEVENYIASLLPALETLPSLPQRIFDELQRFGPPSLPAFPTLSVQVVPAPPPPPPPPPAPKGWCTWFGGMAGGGAMRRITVGVVVTASLGLASVYGYKRWRLHVLKKRKSRKLARTPLVTDGHRREAIVVLGADHPLGLPVCASLEKQGYIVIATTSTPSYASKLTKASSGYLRIVPLEPAEPVLSTAQANDGPSAFPSKLQVALSQRFPTNSAGDPYISAQHIPYVTGVVSLMSLPSPAPTPIAHLPMKEQYLPHLIASHFTPIMLLQSLLPVMHRSPLGRTPTIIALVPGLSSLPGTPFSGASSASTQATRSMLTSMRRELAQAHDPTKLMTLSVGTIALPSEGYDVTLPPEAKEAYGSALEAAMTSVGRRTWTNANRVTRVIGKIFQYSDTPLGTAFYWFKAGTVNVGAGANLYACAARLPAPVLDVLFAIPAWVATLRARLSFIPFVRPTFRRTSARVGREEKKPLSIAPAPIAAPPAPVLTPAPAAPVPTRTSAAVNVHVHDDAVSEPESDHSLEEHEHEHEHSESESDWEKVRDGEAASRVETPALAEPSEAKQAWQTA
ncbi:hypothetical protein DACRYDRAFT_20073 [Dacryopinax primogenitus]|uniref:DUF1776-domain-containing protein n=1 Tax=Dacryopinax primogenitus (strain DJM 731) TaxID=1858805 RepID=M5GB79_DACPD|nr:uncharacterized protein DACRYDRAFT_20073 [Dacryopinax primogenitus]EJU05650.1 hypothetical protein DACRYDRAFT_20073 [Dacryopinax primogenitus]